MAVALYNKNGHAAGQGCEEWNATIGGYFEACGGPSGDIACFTHLSVQAAQDACCANAQCAGFSYLDKDGSGCYKTNTDCGIVKMDGYQGFAKPGFKPTPPAPTRITVQFTSLGLPSRVRAPVCIVLACMYVCVCVSVCVCVCVVLF
jgi:hypothetical protein